MIRRSIAGAVLLLGACTGGSEGAGSNTNWLTCEQSSDCPGDSVCVSRSCATVDSEACAAGAVVTIESGSAALEARHGSFFADALYEPVFNDSQPTGWVDPVTPAVLTAHVTDAGGAPVSGCSLRWLTHDDSGWVFPDASSSDDQGSVRARWIAGGTELQTLTVALIDEDGRASSADLTGHALTHDPLTVEPTMPYLDLPLSADADALRVRVRPLSAPHHSFFVTALPSFFMGLQNTSDADAFSSEIAASDRLFIASVWNRSAGPAEQLWAAPDVSCGPHEQDLGGIRCELQDAWQPGDAKDLVVEVVHLLSGAAAPAEYADLGYSEGPCTSADGCTDYSVFIATADEEPRRMAALRIATAVAANAVASYIDAYASSDTQTSCLLTPLYQAEFDLAERIDGTFVPVSAGSYSASYQLWANQICANHGAVAGSSGFVLSTGGAELLSEPVLPGDPARELALP